MPRATGLATGRPHRHSHDSAKKCGSLNIKTIASPDVKLSLPASPPADYLMLVGRGMVLIIFLVSLYRHPPRWSALPWRWPGSDDTGVLGATDYRNGAMGMRLATEVRGRRRAAATRKNVWRHARGRLPLTYPYSRPLDLRLGLHLLLDPGSEHLPLTLSGGTMGVKRRSPRQAGRGEGKRGAKESNDHPGRGLSSPIGPAFNSGPRAGFPTIIVPSTPDYASQNASQK
jgi:hypothetical protein